MFVCAMVAEIPNPEKKSLFMLKIQFNSIQFIYSP